MNTLPLKGLGLCRPFKDWWATLTEPAQILHPPAGRESWLWHLLWRIDLPAFFHLAPNEERGMDDASLDRVRYAIGTTSWFRAIVEAHVPAPECPPGWAFHTDEMGKGVYMLALYADTPDEAEAIAVAEARRHIVAFAEQVAEWLKGTWRCSSTARDEYRIAIDKGKVAKAPQDYAGDEERPIHFEEWSIGEILKAARGERTLG